MLKELSKETLDIIEGLKKIDGHCRGVSLQGPLDYIRLKEGEEVFKQVEERLRGFGLPELKDIKVLEKYPISWMTTTHLVIMESLGWTYEDVKTMGDALPKISFIVRMFMKNFLSARKSFYSGSGYWSKHFDIGTLETVEFDDVKRIALVRIKDYKTHPVDCKLLEGYILRLSQYMLEEKLSIKETKCIFNGDSYHEYLMTW